MTAITYFENMTEGQAIRNLSFWTTEELQLSLKQQQYLMRKYESGWQFDSAKFLDYCISKVLESRR